MCAYNLYALPQRMNSAAQVAVYVVHVAACVLYFIARQELFGSDSWAAQRSLAGTAASTASK